MVEINKVNPVLIEENIRAMDIIVAHSYSLF